MLKTVLRPSNNINNCNLAPLHSLSEQSFKSIFISPTLATLYGYQSVVRSCKESIIDPSGSTVQPLFVVNGFFRRQPSRTFSAYISVESGGSLSHDGDR